MTRRVAVLMDAADSAMRAPKCAYRVGERHVAQTRHDAHGPAWRASTAFVPGGPGASGGARAARPGASCSAASCAAA